MKIDRKAFERWLKKQDAKNTVGYSFNGSGCPLATFATIQLGAFVGVKETSHCVAGKWEPNEPWVKAFVKGIDVFKKQAKDGNWDGQAITAKKALDVLAKVPA